MIAIRLPDGRKINVQTDNLQEAARLAHQFGQENPHPGTSAWDTYQGLRASMLDAAVPGLGGVTKGVENALQNAVTAPFSSSVDFHPLQSFREGRALQNAREQATQENHPALSTAAQGAGILSGLFLPASKIAKGASLAQKVAAGAKTAGAYGALSGVLSSKAHSPVGVLSDALSSGALSAGVGAAFPMVAKGAAWAVPPLRPMAAPLVRAAGRGLQSVAPYVPGIGGTLAREGAQLSRDPSLALAHQALDRDLRGAVNPATGRDYTPMQVAQAVTDRQALGVPAAPADIHESARRAFAAAARAPGPATAAVRRAIDQRQEQSSARTARHIQDTLGPTTNVQALADHLDETAKANAGPLYDIAYQQNIPAVTELQQLFSRPAAHASLQHAAEMMANEGINPKSMGLIQGQDGIFRLGKTPKMQAYDYAKTALDGAAADVSNPLATSDTRRTARGADSIRRRLLEIMDGDGSGPRVHSPGVDIAPTAPGVPPAPAPMAPQAPQGLPGQPALPTPPPRTIQAQRTPMLPQGQEGVQLPPIDLPQGPQRIPLDAPNGPVNPMPQEASTRAVVPYQAPGVPGGAGSTVPAPYGAPGVPGGLGSEVPALPGQEHPQPFDFGRRLDPEEPPVIDPAQPRQRRTSAIPPEGLNPFWKPARDAYAGPTQNRKALQLGEEMTKDDGEDITNALGDLSPGQVPFFRLGHRAGLAKDVKSLGDWGNAAARVAGSAEKREGLQAAHGPAADDLLARTLGEHEAHQTYKAVRGNSQTADRLSEMAGQDQQIEAAAHGVLQALAGNPGIGIPTALGALASGDRKGAAAVKGHMARILGEMDPEAINAAMRGIYREKARQALVSQNQGEALQRGSRFLGDLVGTNMIEPAPDGSTDY